jgi:GxxExxY protein
MIIGAAMEVHKTLGCGFLEAVYQEALAEEFRRREIPFKREVDIPVSYKGVELKTVYRVDFLCFNEVLVEIKALEVLTGIERAQVINYLKAAEIERALLINFGTVSLQYERLVLDYSE